MDLIKQIDLYYLEYFYLIKNYFFDLIFSTFQLFGKWQFLVIFSIFVFASEKQINKPIIYKSLILGIIVLSLKFIFHKARPITGEYLYLGFSFYNDNNFFSFVSGDVVVALLLKELLLNKVNLTFLNAIVIIVSLGRLYTYQHFLSDVIVSYLTYSIVTFLLNKIKHLNK